MVTESIDLEIRHWIIIEKIATLLLNLVPIYVRNNIDIEHTT